MSAASLAPALETEAPLRERLFPNGEWVLLAVLAAECVVFGLTGHNFLGAANGFEITRLAVEIGLLALALTPVIITGGRGTLAGTLIGAALLGTIGTALTFLGINPFWEKAIQGAIILAALVSDVAIGRLEHHVKRLGTAGAR